MCDDCDCKDILSCCLCCNACMNEQNRNQNQLQRQKEKEARELEKLMGPNKDPNTFEMSRVKF